MKKYLSKFLIIFVFSFVLILNPVFSQGLKDAFGSNSSNQGPVQPGASETPLGTVVTAAGYDPSNTFDGMVGKMILAALSLLGIVFLVLLVYAGYLWMTASGNETQASKAKSIIITSVIGLLIVLSAYSISYFVLSSLQEGSLK